VAGTLCSAESENGNSYGNRRHVDSRLIVSVPDEVREGLKGYLGRLGETDLARAFGSVGRCRSRERLRAVLSMT